MQHAAWDDTATVQEWVFNLFIGEAATEANCRLSELHTLRFYSTAFMLNDMPVVTYVNWGVLA